MAIFRTSRSESTTVGGVGSHIEDASIGSVPCDTIAPEVADVFGERCRPKPAAMITDHARLDHYPTRRRAKRCRRTASAEAGACPLSRPAKAPPREPALFAARMT